VDRRERERILGEWGVREESTRSLAERSLLDRDLDGSPLTGQPLPRRPRNFRPGVDSYVLSRGGPAPYMRRLRQIEHETEEHERGLSGAWRELAERCRGDADGFARRWRRLAERHSFDPVNDLIERHNRFYPIAARLPMDPRSRDFALVGGCSYRRPKLDGRWVLEHFPADLRLAS
jgi:hypothetical protein